MTILQKVEKLRSVGWCVEKREKGWVAHHEKRNIDNPTYCSHFGLSYINHIYTDREIAKLYRQEFVKPKRWKQYVKKLSSDKDRTAKRDFIITERFDDIPLDRRIKIEDKWSWD